MQHKFDNVIDGRVAEFLKNRSEASFLKLYSEYNSSLYRIACSLVNYDANDAEDVLQDTWLIAIKNLGSFRGESSFKTWITSILINKCREKCRENAKNNSQILTKEFIVNYTTQIPTGMMDIHEALKSLAPGYREVLVLHDVEGYKHSEIAKLLGITAGTSKSQLFNARRIVRNYLKENVR